MADRKLLAEAARLFNRKYYFECHELLEDVKRLEPFAPDRDGLNLKRLCTASQMALEKAICGFHGEEVAWTEDDVPSMEILESK